jgi:hypothetical protein
MTALAQVPALPPPYLQRALQILYRYDYDGVRDALLNIWGVCNLARLRGQRCEFGTTSAPWSLESLAALFQYGSDDETPDCSDERVCNVDVDVLVVKWIPVIRGLSAGHDKTEVDRCEFESQELLAPLLTAPVEQMREFFDKLCTALRTDPTIPMFVHVMFDAYHEAVVKPAPDQAVKELKTALATEIAEMVERDVVPDIKSALIGALQWRPTEVLEKVKEAVQSGAKPRLRGRESCLFLVVPTSDGEATVML